MVSLPGRGRAASLVDSYWSTLPARSAFPPGGSRPWVGLVDVPVPGHVEKPASVLTRLQPEPGDHPLTALVIAVEQVNGQETRAFPGAPGRPADLTASRCARW